MTERTGSVRTAIARTLRSARSTRTRPTSSHPFYRSLTSSVCYVPPPGLREALFVKAIERYGIRQIVPFVLCEGKAKSNLGSCVPQFATKRPSNKELSSSNSSLSSTSETANESTSPNTPEAAPRARRRVRQSNIINPSLTYRPGIRCMCFSQ